jgi:hypothetical protein
MNDTNAIQESGSINTCSATANFRRTRVMVGTESIAYWCVDPVRLSKARDDIGWKSARLRVAPLNETREICFSLSRRQHAHQDLRPRFAKHVALATESMECV